MARRAPVNKRRSASKFRRQVRTVKSPNVRTGSPRGGGRL